MSLRYLQTAHKHATITTMIKICFLSICIATFSLALIISIKEGFEQATYEKMQSIYPQIIIDADGQELNYQNLMPILQDPTYNIAHFAPEQMQQALCTTTDNEQMPYVIFLKGIDPNAEKLVTPIQSMILPKNQPHFLEKLLVNNQVIIGKQLAKQLQISTGSILTLIYTQCQDLTQTKEFLQHKMIIAGIFDTGIDDFDTNFIYCSHDFFATIFPEHGITQIYAKALPGSDEKQVMEKLHLRLHLNVYSWKKLYSSLVSALELEKYAMFFIILLIALIACANIISLLFMQITQKYKDIALLLTLGLTQQKVKNVFLAMIMVINSCAAFTGLCLAYGVGTFLQKYQWIKLPDDIYYTTHLPIIINLNLFLFIFFAVLLLSFFASLIPLSKIKVKNIANILRNEI